MHTYLPGSSSYIVVIMSSVRLCLGILVLMRRAGVTSFLLRQWFFSQSLRTVQFNMYVSAVDFHFQLLEHQVHSVVRCAIKVSCLIPWVAAHVVRWSGAYPWTLVESRLVQQVLRFVGRGNTVQYVELRGYCPWGWGVRPVNWIYRLWRHCP